MILKETTETYGKHLALSTFRACVAIHRKYSASKCFMIQSSRVDTQLNYACECDNKEMREQTVDYLITFIS